MKRCITLLLILASVSLYSADRSHEWSRIRKAHLKTHPVCAICGTAKDLQVHHILTFDRHPERELDPSNLMTVCTSKYWGWNCHLVIHGGSFMLENPWAEDDAVHLRALMDPGYIKEHSYMELKLYMYQMYERVKDYNCSMYGYRCTEREQLSGNFK